MSAIELPATTRRSLRFKRFSWNRADDGTFPPITAAAAAATPRGSRGGPDEARSPKRASKQHGKKRKIVYLGPSWDDEAGTLPTSAGPDEMDFDSLLSQMQSQQQGAAPSKHKKTHGASESDRAGSADAS